MRIKKINFSKMHGLGNDFMIVNNLKQKILFTKKIITILSDRYTGVGFDQLLVLEKSNDFKVDFFLKIFNSNGREVFQCGNGARCIAYFIYINKLKCKKKIKVKTKLNKLTLFVKDKKNICVNMGIPIFDLNRTPCKIKENKQVYSIKIKNKKLFFWVLWVGNPHCILKVKNIKNTKVSFFGKILEKYKLFPEHINVSFMEIVHSKCIKLRVYERNVGETNSCGSAACAAVAVGVKEGFLEKSVLVCFKGGNLNVFWNGLGCPIFINGPVEHVYDGVFFFNC